MEKERAKNSYSTHEELSTEKYSATQREFNITVIRIGQ
jgi:hypothetical protein